MPANIEAARCCLVDGIVEAMDRGVRSLDSLIAASLAKLTDMTDAGAFGTQPDGDSIPSEAPWRIQWPRTNL